MTAGTRLAAASRRPVPRASGPTRRTCPDCGEQLSAYNPGPRCYAHTVDVPWKGPNQRA